MMIDFELAKCKSKSDKKLFGLCDNPSPAQDPAYIDEENGAKWIAVVENEFRYQTIFTAIDHCIILRDLDGNIDKRCDGMLTYNSTVVFVELKKRGAKGNAWVEDAVPQLKNTIKHFEKTVFSEKFNLKMAYIANSEHPKFKSSQIGRMQNFFHETGYILRIIARIKLL